MSQWAGLAITEELAPQMDSLKIMVRGHFPFELDSAFQDVIFEVQVQGAVSPEQLEGLARRASRHCYVENTLAKAIPVTTEVYLNGSKILTLSRGPAGAPAG